MILRDLYTDLLRGNLDNVFDQENVQMINSVTSKLLSKPSWTNKDIEDADLILRISNILYNNTDFLALPLEDGIYDLLLEAYRKYNPHFQVGSEVVHFKLQSSKQPKSSKNEPHYIEAIVSYPKEAKETIYEQVFTETPTNRFQEAYATHHATVSDRGRDTAHKYPKLVGTLDKCKFVTDKDAQDAMVYKDPKVRIFERDFLAKHLMMGLIGYNQPIEMVAEIKYDGLSVEAEVNNQIVSARTRGDLDADLATDLTDILAGYRFPNNISNDEIIGMKFEAIITKEDLIKFENATGKEYKNMRTAIAGIIGSANARDYINFITLVPLATSLEFNNRIEELEFMNRYFATKEPNRYQYMVGDFANLLFQVKKFTDEAAWYRDYMPFAYDGIVVSYIDKNIINALGRENHVNKYSVAIKFNAMVRTTRFRGYQYTIGKNGVITPMIMFDPVEFNGTIHNLASGHSYERFKALALKYGDLIDVTYVNDVMPYVSNHRCPENDANPNKLERFIDICPSCGSTLEESISGKSVVCPNPDCPGRGLARMEDMLQKINFRDFSGATIRELNITSFTQLINITKDQLTSLGEVNSAKFMDRINELKTNKIYDYNIIGALGFSDIAIKSWKLILHELRLEEIMNLDPATLEFKLLKIKGIGKVATETIINERHLFMQDLVTISEMPNVVRTCGLVDNRKKIVITGFRDDTLSDLVSPLGYFVTDSGVTRDTSILLIPQPGFASSKVDKAMKYGVQIETIMDFRKRLGL